MTDENWVKLPDPRPSMLPQGTLIILCAWCKGTLRWAVTDALVSEDNLGLVRYRGRAASNGEPDKTFVVASENISRVKLPPGYRFEGSEVVKDEPKPEPTYATFAQACASRQNQAEQQRGSGIESPLARAVREQVAQIEAYTAQAYQQQIYAQQGGLGLSDYVFRQGDYRQEGGNPLYGDCPRPECARKSWNPMRDRCDHCGVTGKEIAAKRAKPACKCGATENVRPIAVAYVTSWGKKQPGGEDICAPCYVARRRSELQAQKLEQTKRDMNRPVKRDPYEWLGFSSADWEE